MIENEGIDHQTTSEDITKTKKDKYQGLLNFAAEIKEEEQKNNLKNDKFTLKFPSFLKLFNNMSLSPGKKKRSRKLKRKQKKII